jgi:hypothetical protein
MLNIKEKKTKNTVKCTIIKGNRNNHRRLTQVIFISKFIKYIIRKKIVLETLMRISFVPDHISIILSYSMNNIIKRNNQVYYKAKNFKNVHNNHKKINQEEKKTRFLIYNNNVCLLLLPKTI